MLGVLLVLCCLEGYWWCIVMFSVGLVWCRVGLELL